MRCFRNHNSQISSSNQLCLQSEVSLRKLANKTHAPVINTNSIKDLGCALYQLSKCYKTTKEESLIHEKQPFNFFSVSKNKSEMIFILFSATTRQTLLVQYFNCAPNQLAYNYPNLYKPFINFVKKLICFSKLSTYNNLGSVGCLQIR